MFIASTLPLECHPDGGGLLLPFAGTDSHVLSCLQLCMLQGHGQGTDALRAQEEHTNKMV